MKAPITQTPEWKELQDDLKEISFFEQGSGYQYLAILKNTPVGNYLYLPYGPVFKDKQGRENSLKSLNNLAKKHQAIFIRIEPMNTEFVEHLPQNARKVKDQSPKDTWVLDLTPDKAELLTNFSQGTRTRYNTFAKKGLSVEKTTNPEDIKHLVDLQNKLFKSKKLHSYGEAYLKTELKQPFATLYLVKYHQPTGEPSTQTSQNNQTPKDGQVLAASLFFDYQNTRYYMQSAADMAYRKLPATVALLSTAIFDAKEQGIKYFDFWGIAPDGAPKDHPWQGFTEFKKSFGGAAVHYAGTYDLILNPHKYRLYNSLRKLKRMI